MIKGFITIQGKIYLNQSPRPKTNFANTSHIRRISITPLRNNDLVFGLTDQYECRDLRPVSI